MPIMRDPARSAKMRALNAIYKDEASKHTKVYYVDAYHMFDSSTGKYTAYLRDQKGVMRKMRASDGIHLTTAGADYLAYRTLKRMYAAFDIHAAP